MKTASLISVSNKISIRLNESRTNLEWCFWGTSFTGNWPFISVFRHLSGPRDLTYYFNHPRLFRPQVYLIFLPWKVIFRHYYIQLRGLDKQTDSWCMTRCFVTQTRWNISPKIILPSMWTSLSLVLVRNQLSEFFNVTSLCQKETFAGR